MFPACCLLASRVSVNIFAAIGVPVSSPDGQAPRGMETAWIAQGSCLWQVQYWEFGSSGLPKFPLLVINFHETENSKVASALSCLHEARVPLYFAACESGTPLA